MTTNYAWSFGGAELDVGWPGRPFANDCTAMPCEGYVQYPFPEPGTYAIGLAVGGVLLARRVLRQWRRLATGARRRDHRRAAQNVTVVEARPVLTNPYD